MKSTYKLFAYPRGDAERKHITEQEFTKFISELSADGRKFIADPWSSKTEDGFIVWFFVK